MITLTIDDRNVSVEKGSTIMEAAKVCGVDIPALCTMEDIHKIGACRICSVEVEGANTLVASCVANAAEGMVVKTNTAKVRKARQVLYNLILSDHSKECLSCNRNQSCELQELGERLGITETLFEEDSSRQQLDQSVSITRDLSKCVLCRRCVTVCNEVQGVGVLNAQNRGFDTIIAPAMDLPIKDANCTYCGQCTVVCPVGALKETDSIQQVWDALDNPNKRVAIQAAPAVRVALGEMFGYPVGTRVTGKMAAAMRALGAEDIFDTDWAADLTIMEEGTEFLGRVMNVVQGKGSVLPMITSCSPGWIKYVEHNYPEQLGHLSSCKSPHMMLGAMVKSYYAEQIDRHPDDFFVVSIMPCTAKKFEISREEMMHEGRKDVDAVITTREFGRMLNQMGINLQNLEDEVFDEPLGMSTGAADIFGLTGGVMEAALRTVYHIITGRNIPFDNLRVTPIVGNERIKEATIVLENVLPEYSELEGMEVNIAVTSGLEGADQLMQQVEAGMSPYHFIEVMGCPGGCITGGGQPRSEDPNAWEKRQQALYTEDEQKTLRQSHENPSLHILYKEYLGEPCGTKSHQLLHTSYVERGLIQAKEVEEEEPTFKRTRAKSYSSHKMPGVQHAPLREKVDMEPVKTQSLEEENIRLRNQIADIKETADIYKQVIDDLSKQQES